jgi:DNA-directed RNA polymerase specialized sigma24 family protein
MKRTNRVTRKHVPTWATSPSAIAQALLKGHMDKVRICSLAWCSGWTAGEIGAALKLKPSHVRTILTRARKGCATEW